MNCTSVCYQCFTLFRHIFMKILGLSPWTNTALCKNRKNSDDEYKFSYSGTFFNILLSIAINLVLIHTALNAWKSTDIRNWKLEDFLAVIAHVSLFWTSVVQIVYTIRQKLIISVSNKIRNVTAELRKCAGYEEENDYGSCAIFFITVSFTLFLILLRGLFNKAGIKLFILSLPYLISSTHIVQYVSILNVITIRFKTINSVLLKMHTSKNKTLRSRDSIIMDIERIKQAYVELFNICKDVENFFGLPVLIIILILSARSVFNLYCIIIVVIHIETMDFRTYQHIVFASQTIFLYTILTSTVTKLIRQSAKTAKIVNLLMDRKSKCEEIHQKLAKFSKDLLGLAVEFTACDIIPLDRNFLAIIIGTISTYLVIAIQFCITTNN